MIENYIIVTTNRTLGCEPKEIKFITILVTIQASLTLLPLHTFPADK